MLRDPLPPDTYGWVLAPGRLSMREREEIRAGLEREETLTAIARTLRRSVSSVSREVFANGGRKRYEARRAHERAYERSRRPKPTRLSHKPLAAKVIEGLEQWWSPEEIVFGLRAEFAHDPMMQVSHETIYQALYLQGRGELRRELHRCLRSGRAQRRPRGRMQSQGVIPNMVMISERPAQIEDRAVPGHWEGDLIIGKNSRSAVGTLVERSTRFVILLHLPDGREAEKVEAAMRKAIIGLPNVLRRSITWDQGKEMSGHQRFTVDTGVQIYFCDPHSPWQRGSNENTNGLLRQYMPKGTDLLVHSAKDLERFAVSLNNRPRKTLGYMKPSEKLAELLVLTA
jgi:transposase, IS30 family